MKGFTASGKSTVASLLASSLPQTKLLRSAITRKDLGLEPGGSAGYQYKYELNDPTFINIISPLVYTENAKRAVADSINFQFVIIDSTYNFRWQREEVYQLAHGKGQDVVIIQCTCPDDEVIKGRLIQRSKRGDDILGEINAWDTYISTTLLAEPVTKIELNQNPHLSMLEINTISGAIKIITNKAQDVRSFNKLNDRLKTFEPTNI